MEDVSKDELIAVAMSGGVDSSVAAAILVEQGYNVVGVTMKLWNAPESGEINDKTCCTLDSSMDARRVCDQLGIPHYTIDMTEDFQERVVEPFYASYMQAKTPNPCVNCNSFVKWDALWKKVYAIGASYLATGHYALVEKFENRSYIVRGEDRNKDQSYFLWGVPPETLAKTLFPVSHLTKPEVREVGRRHKLRNAEKSESMDICFIPDGDKNKFLKDYAEKKGETFTPGKILGPEEEVVGEHEGLPFYTIGQRKGLGVAIGEPAFVKKIDRESNTLWLGRKGDLDQKSFKLEQLNWFGENFSEDGEECYVQVRYRSRPLKCKVFESSETGVYDVLLEDAAFAISVGQSAVFYEGDRVVGGGIIL